MQVPWKISINKNVYWQDWFDVVPALFEYPTEREKKQEMLFFILHCVRASWIPSCFIAPKLVTFNRSYRSSQLQSYFMSVIESYFMSVKSAFKGTVMEIKKVLINDRLGVSKVSWKLCIPTIPWDLIFSVKVAYSFYCLFCL